MSTNASPHPNDATQTLDAGARGCVVVFPDPEALARATAQAFARITTEAVAARDRAFVALSGGSTPKRMGELLATLEYRDSVPWQDLQILWGDERWVPEESEESNAGVARRSFLSKVPLPVAHIHPFPTEGLEPDAAAEAYGVLMRTIVTMDDGLPRFDLVILGMGDDGHTASLFPGTAAVREQEAQVVAHHVPKLDAIRLTLTAPVLNAGRELLFLIAGEQKAQMLKRVLEGDESTMDLPARIIQPASGNLTWFVDRAAAAELTLPEASPAGG